MNKQEIFDTVAKHLFTQGTRSINDDDNMFCMYRGPHGLKCAVGALIPDDVYIEGMDNFDGFQNSGVFSLIGKYKHLLPEWFEENKQMLHELQQVHDNEASWNSEDYMKLRLEHIAEAYDISPAVLNGLRFC